MISVIKIDRTSGFQVLKKKKPASKFKSFYILCYHHSADVSEF